MSSKRKKAEGSDQGALTQKQGGPPKPKRQRPNKNTNRPFNKQPPPSNTTSSSSQSAPKALSNPESKEGEEDEEMEMDTSHPSKTKTKPKENKLRDPELPPSPTEEGIRTYCELIHQNHAFKYLTTQYFRRIGPHLYSLVSKADLKWNQNVPSSLLKQPVVGIEFSRGKWGKEEAMKLLEFSKKMMQKMKVGKLNNPTLVPYSPTPFLLVEYTRAFQLEGFKEGERLLLVEEINRLRKDRHLKDDFREGKAIGRGSGKIHDLIDPSKNLRENVDLNVMNCIAKLKKTKVNDEGKCIIKSEILNFNHRKYPKLQNGIASLFSSMLPIFERVLGHPNLKNKDLRVIVKMHTYILQRGERFTSGEHREGFGENIKAVGIYYPEISNIKGGDLVITAESASNDGSRDPLRVTKLCLRDFALALRWSASTNTVPPRPNWKQKNRYVPVREGSAIVFVNRTLHHPTPMERTEPPPPSISTSSTSASSSAPLLIPPSVSPGRRTIIAFLLCDGKHLLPTTDDIPIVNWRFKIPYIIAFWNRKFTKFGSIHMNWMSDLVTCYLVGDKKYVKSWISSFKESRKKAHRSKYYYIL